MAFVVPHYAGLRGWPRSLQHHHPRSGGYCSVLISDSVSPQCVAGNTVEARRKSPISEAACRHFQHIVKLQQLFDPWWVPFGLAQPIDKSFSHLPGGIFGYSCPLDLLCCSRIIFGQRHGVVSLKRPRAMIGRGGREEGGGYKAG